MSFDRPEEAIAAYEASLEIWPRRYNSLRGAALSADAAGDFVAASHYWTAVADLLDADSKPARADGGATPAGGN